MHHQVLAANIRDRDIYPELKRYFYKEQSNVRWEDFQATKRGLWINEHLSTESTLQGSDRAVEKSNNLL